MKILKEIPMISFRMKTIMAGKDEVVRSILNSKSLRATAPLRVIWKYIKSVH